MRAVPFTPVQALICTDLQVYIGILEAIQCTATGGGGRRCCQGAVCMVYMHTLICTGSFSTHLRSCSSLQPPSPVRAAYPGAKQLQSGL
jgi:hypothetical protein